NFTLPLISACCNPAGRHTLTGFCIVHGGTKMIEVVDHGRDLSASTGRWQALAESVLAGEPLAADDALAVLASPDEELLDLLAAVYRVRRRYFGNKVQLYFLMNAKSGLCPEDCGYCSQSKVSEAEIPRYNLLTAEKLLDGARVAAERNAKTY